MHNLVWSQLNYGHCAGDAHDGEPDWDAVFGLQLRRSHFRFLHGSAQKILTRRSSYGDDVFG